MELEANRTGRRVGVLSNIQLLRDCLARALVTSGLEVVAATASADVLLERVRADQAEAAIVDVRSAGDANVDPRNLRLLRELRSEQPSMRILALTANRPAVVEAAWREGATAVVDVARSGLDSVLQLLSPQSELASGEQLAPGVQLDTASTGGSNQLRADASSPLQADPTNAVFRRLTPRERQVLALIAEGLDNGEIALRLRIGQRTVKAYVTALYQKAHTDNRVQLALLGRQCGLRPDA